MAHTNVRFNLMIKQDNTWYAPRTEPKSIEATKIPRRGINAYLQRTPLLKQLIVLFLTAWAQRKEFFNSRNFLIPLPSGLIQKYMPNGQEMLEVKVLISLKVPRDHCGCRIVREDHQRTLWAS